ncbi:TPA: hypothetical protein ACH3X1_007772 [Trebouxia sp. C0004]
MHEQATKTSQASQSTQNILDKASNTSQLCYLDSIGSPQSDKRRHLVGSLVISNLVEVAAEEDDGGCDAHHHTGYHCCWAHIRCNCTSWSGNLHVHRVILLHPRQLGLCTAKLLV